MIAPRLLIAGICLPFLSSGVPRALDFITPRSVPAIIAALALAAFTIGATVIAHSHQVVIFVEHLSIAFSLAFVAWWNWRAA